MFSGNMGPSLADIAAVTGNRNNGDGMFGGNNGWWVLIILFAIFGGWGNNGYGNGNGGGSAQFTDAALQRGFDTQTVINKLDGISNGICSLGYDQLAQMNGIQNTVMQTGWNLQQAINGDTVANMQNTNALSRQLSECCCENREAIAQVRYDMATDTCALRNEIHQTGDAIIQNNNNNFRALNDTIRDGFTALAMNQKDQQIAELQMKLNACDRDSALQGTAAYIINNVAPRSQPAYLTCNPNTGMVFPQSMNGYGWNNGGCCNNNNGCGCNCG